MRTHKVEVTGFGKSLMLTKYSLVIGKEEEEGTPLSRR